MTITAVFVRLMVGKQVTWDPKPEEVEDTESVTDLMVGNTWEGLTFTACNTS